MGFLGAPRPPLGARIPTSRHLSCGARTSSSVVILRTLPPCGETRGGVPAKRSRGSSSKFILTPLPEDPSLYSMRHRAEPCPDPTPPSVREPDRHQETQFATGPERFGQGRGVEPGFRLHSILEVARPD